MEIIIGKNAGFCFGVKNAVENTEIKLQENLDMKCLGELVHNKNVINRLKKEGLTIVESIEQVKENDKLIIRAHGIPKQIYTIAQEKNIEIYDYTCPSVLRIHKLAEEYANKKYFIVLIGNKKHPESVGTISFCGNNSYLLEDEEEIEELTKILNKNTIKKVMIIAQTTFSLEKFKKLVEKIKNSLKPDIEIEEKNTICNATKIRQEETKELSKKVECMIIIGGKNSSNTKKLYEIAKENCRFSYLVESKEELELEEIKKYNKIGIMAGASTPIQNIEEISDLLGTRPSGTPL